MAGKFTFTLQDHQAAAIKYRKELLMLPIIGIEKNLKDCGFSVRPVPDSPDAIINHRFAADIVLYYPTTGEDSHIGITMNLLGELCQDDSKLLCLTGDVHDIEAAMDSKGAGRVSRTYPRPVDPVEFMDDMEYYSGLLKEYHRKGLGRSLFEEAVRIAKEMHYSFLQVKTVRMGMYEDYDKTNRFYLACGFKELEVIPQIWGEENPCQIYVRYLK